MPSDAPSADGANVRTEVEQRFATLAEAARDLDHAAYFAHFDKQDFTVLNSDGTVTLRFEDFRRDYLAGTQAMSGYVSLEFVRVSVQEINEDAAVLVNEYVAVIELEDGSEARFAGAGTQVWKRSNGEWKLTHISSSMKPQ